MDALHGRGHDVLRMVAGRHAARRLRRVGPKIGLWSVQPGKGEPKLLAEFRSGAITAPRFAPDGKSVVFVYGTSSNDVVLISDLK